MPVTPAWRASSSIEIIFNGAFGKKIHKNIQARLGVPELGEFFMSQAKAGIGFATSSIVATQDF